MKKRFYFVLGLVWALTLSQAAHGEQHRATHLGNPVTRFAPTMFTPDDLRARFQDPQLRPDFVEVLRQWGWPGNLDDFFAAGLTNEIMAMDIPVGSVMPFMSSRDGGKPICLRNVLWAGKEPISAYAFTFLSNGRIYRCIIPKPCSNFFVMDLGEAPRSALAIDCDLPEKILVGQKFKACANIHNIGNLTASNVLVSLPVPDNSVVTATTDGGVVTNNAVEWTLANLPANVSKSVCARFKPSQVGTLHFNPIVRGDNVAPQQSSCEIAVSGIAAILLEKADHPDPVAIGDTTTYTVKVTNQGSADDANVQVVVTLAPELVPVSASTGSISGQRVTLPVVPVLAAKQAVTYTIIAKGVKAGDGHTRFDLTSDLLKPGIYAEESTMVY